MRLKAQDLVELLQSATGERIEPKGEETLLRKAAPVTIKSMDEKARSVRVIASTESIDSYDECVVQDWDLSRYEKNAPVLYLHNAGGGFCGPSTKDTFPVGYATDVAVVDGQLEATLNFVDANASPLAEYVWQGIVQGSLRAVSVGFCPRDVKPGKKDGEDVLFLSGNELFEISVVPIPANPDAVALMHSRNAKLARARMATIRQKATQPPERGQEKTMDEKQIKELQAELERAKAACAIATNEAEKARADLASVKSALDARDSELATLKKLSVEAVAEHDETKKSLAAALEESKGLQGKLIELEVDALVGKKISAAEKADMIELRTANPKLFASMIEKRADMKLTEVVVSDDANTKNTASEKGGASARLAAAAQKSAAS
jgi:hypothetical protein